MHEDLPFSAPAERNQAPILDVLRRVLPASASVLEIASGTGQHAAHFAAAQPAWTWQPTDIDATMLPAIARRCAGLQNVRAPRQLDVLAWPEMAERFDAVYCANMLHIAPWESCRALLRGAAGRLTPAGSVVLYGPYFVDGEPPAPGNVAFDIDLRARDARWGVRRLAAVIEEATAAGLAFEERIAMPANNFTLVFRAVQSAA
jgi:SAM-dependent methyltransferase